MLVHIKIKRKIPYSLNIVPKFNLKIVERGKIDTSIYMIALLPGLVYSLP
jgi:hypothetical protein